MKLKKAYYYLFYKFYKLFEVFEQTRWLTDLKAGALVLVLEVFLLISLKVYYTDFFNRNDEFEFASAQTLLPCFLLFLLNYFAFIYNEKWRGYVEEFDRWPAEKKEHGLYRV